MSLMKPAIKKLETRHRDAERKQQVGADYWQEAPGSWKRRTIEETCVDREEKGEQAVSALQEWALPSNSKAWGQNSRYVPPKCTLQEKHTTCQTFLESSCWVNRAMNAEPAAVPRSEQTPVPDLACGAESRTKFNQYRTESINTYT